MQYPNGLYVSVSFSDETKRMLTDLMEELGVPNPVPADDLHTTVLYSETPVEQFDLFSSNTQLTTKIEVQPHSFEVFGGEGESCLVLKLTSPKLYILHHTIKNATGSVPTYPTYQPHVTFSYDCPNAEKWLAMDPKQLIKQPIEIVAIHTKPREEDWAPSSD